MFWVQSNCWSRSEREKVFDELLKHMKIDSFGPCRHNAEYPDWASQYGIESLILR